MAFEVFKSALARNQYECIYLITNKKDADEVTLLMTDANKYTKHFMWFDVAVTKEEWIVQLMKLLETHPSIHAIFSQDIADDWERKLTSYEIVTLDELSDGIDQSHICAHHDELCLLMTIHGKSYNILDYFKPEDLAKVIQQASQSSTGKGKGNVGGVYADNASTWVRVLMSDVKFVHEMRDRVLMGEFDHDLSSHLQNMEIRVTVPGEQSQLINLQSSEISEIKIKVDRSAFAQSYATALTSLDKLTPHQHSRLDKAEKHDKNVNLHIKAPAGGGKTFVGVHLIVRLLAENETAKILFVSPNDTLCYSIAKWILARLKDNDVVRKEALASISFLVTTSDQGRHPRQIYHEKRKRRLQFQEAKSTEKTVFNLVVVDEAHHAYTREASRRMIEEHVSDTTRLVLLSDRSQASSKDIQFPPKLQEIYLKEVVRSTKRITEGAAAFALEADEETQCHHNGTGPPLKSFIFDGNAKHDEEYAREQYVDNTTKAIRHLLEHFKGLSLDDRLVLIVPDEEFESWFKPLFAKHLDTTGDVLLYALYHHSMPLYTTVYHYARKHIVH